MAKEKNSFIVYYDFEEQTATLSDQQVGRLIRVMLDYEKRGVLPDGEDTLVGMAFWFLKVGLDLNDEKYRKVCERNKFNRNGGKRADEYLFLFCPLQRSANHDEHAYVTCRTDYGSGSDIAGGTGGGRFFAGRSCNGSD